MRLPTPPTFREKYSYVEQNKFFLYLFGIISFLFLSVGMGIFIYKYPGAIAYSVFAILMFMYLGLSYYVGVFGETFGLLDHNQFIRRHKFAPDEAPSIDVYLPSCGEPIEVINNTFRYVSKLQWNGKLNIYVLDDFGSKEVKNLAEAYRFYYIHRTNPGEMKKAGNIRYAFKKTTGDFILILDADFVPREEMLYELMPYFRVKSVAIVQSPQFFDIFHEDSVIQKGAAYVQELFYRLIQVNRNTWSASVCVGSCAIYRRSALEPHGGTAAIPYSEDLHTGFQAISDGYKVKYIPINLSKGLCPDNAQAFVSQQYRWCTGSFTLFLNPKFWTADITANQRIAYLSGMLYYIATALGVFLTPIPAIFMLIFHPEGIFWFNVLFSIPSFLYGILAIAMWSKSQWGVHALIIRQITYWAHVMAIYDKIKNKTMPWISTGSISRSGVLFKRFKALVLNWNLIVFVFTFGGIMYRVGEFELYNFIPSLFFCFFNYYIGLIIMDRISD